MKGTLKFLIVAWIVVSMLTYQEGNYTDWNAMHMLANLIISIREELEYLSGVDISGVLDSLEDVRYDLADVADEVSYVADEIAE